MSGPDIIAVLRDRGLTCTVQVEPYLGAGGAGPRYGPAVTVEAFVDETRRKVRNALGEEVLSEATVFARLATTAPEKSRITLPSGRVAYVIASKRRDGGGLPTPDHLEVFLT